MSPIQNKSRDFLQLTGKREHEACRTNVFITYCEAGPSRALCIHLCSVLSFRGLHISIIYPGFYKHFGNENCRRPPQQFVDNQARLYLLCMLELLDHVKTEPPMPAY